MDIISTIKNLKYKIPDYGFDTEIEKELIEYCEFIEKRDDLLKLAQDYHDGIFETSGYSLAEVEELKEHDEREQGLLFACIFFARCELFDEIVKGRAMPSEYKKIMVNLLKRGMKKNIDCYGKCGFCGMYRSGAVKYAYPEIFTLGILNFEMEKFIWPYEVYRNRENGEEIPLATSGYTYLPDGTRTPRNYAKEAFEPSLSESDTEIFGYTFDERGVLDFTGISLKKDKYERVLKAGDDILSVHIPGQGKFTKENVDEAFALADDFFAKYYPEKHFKAYICSSWLLETEIRKFLKPSSNILNFQSRFRIVLSSVNDYSIYWHVFGIEKPIPLEELKPCNKFQQDILDWVKSGGVMHNGSGFIIRK